MLKNQKGITLVALVVTIVVLIILATISVTIAINGGIIQRAEQAENHQANATQFDNEQELNIIAYIDSKITP